MTQALYFSPRITLTLRGLLWFCTNFMIICFRSVKNNLSIFIWFVTIILIFQVFLELFAVHFFFLLFFLWLLDFLLVCLSSFVFSFCDSILFLICGNHGVQDCWPTAIPPCFTLKVTQVQTHSKRFTFYTPVLHILWFWCSTLHFHADPFTVYPVRIAFTIFNCFLISVLVHLNDLPFFYTFVFLIVIFPFPLDSSSLSFQPLPMESSLSLEYQVPDSSIHQ